MTAWWMGNRRVRLRKSICKAFLPEVDSKSCDENQKLEFFANVAYNEYIIVIFVDIYV